MKVIHISYTINYIIYTYTVYIYVCIYTHIIYIYKISCEELNLIQFVFRRAPGGGGGPLPDRSRGGSGRYQRVCCSQQRGPVPAARGEFRGSVGVRPSWTSVFGSVWFSSPPQYVGFIIILILGQLFVSLVLMINTEKVWTFFFSSLHNRTLQISTVSPTDWRFPPDWRDFWLISSGKV